MIVPESGRRSGLFLGTLGGVVVVVGGRAWIFGDEAASDNVRISGLVVAAVTASWKEVGGISMITRPRAAASLDSGVELASTALVLLAGVIGD